MPIAETLGTAAGWGVGHLTKGILKGALEAGGLSKEAVLVSSALAGGMVCFVVDYTVTAAVNLAALDPVGLAANNATTVLQSSLFTAASLAALLMGDRDAGKNQPKRQAR